MVSARTVCDRSWVRVKVGPCAFSSPVTYTPQNNRITITFDARYCVDIDWIDFKDTSTFLRHLHQFQSHMSISTTKPTKWIVRQAKTQISLGIHPVWSVSLLCALSVAAKDPMRTAKTLIRLGGYPGWSESSLGPQVILLVLSCTD